MTEPSEVPTVDLVEIRVHGVNKAEDFSSLGRGRRVRSIANSDTLHPVTTKSPTLWLFNWSETNRRLTGPLWAAALPFTLVNLAGYTGWRSAAKHAPEAGNADAEAGDTTETRPDTDFDARPDPVVRFVVVGQGLVLTCSALIWLIAIIEVIVGHLPYTGGDPAMWAAVVVWGSAGLISLPMLWRCFRLREESLGIKRRCRRFAALHGAALALLAGFLVLVRPGQIVQWRPPFDEMQALLRLPFIGTTGPALVNTELSTCADAPDAGWCYFVGAQFGTLRTYNVLEVLSTSILVGFAFTIFFVIVLGVRAVVLAFAPPSGFTWQISTSVVGAAVMITFGWGILVGTGSALRIGFEWAFAFFGRLLPDALVIEEMVARAQFVVHPAFLRNSSFSITNGILVLNTLAALVLVVAALIGGIFFYIARRDRPDDETGKGLWWRLVNSAIGNLPVVLPVAFIVAMAAWVWLVAVIWPAVVGEISSVLGAQPARVAIAFTRWVSILTLGIALVAFLFAVSVGRWKTVRAPIDIIADVTGFFPIQWHPLAGLSYRSLVMGELESVMALTSGPVIYSGHSQGSVIGLWFLRHRAQRPELIHFVTSGSPIRSLYATFFPRFVNQAVIEEALARVASWQNVWRGTDPIATKLEAEVKVRIAAQEGAPAETELLSIVNVKSLDPPSTDKDFPPEDRTRKMHKARWHLNYWDDYKLVGAVDAVVDHEQGRAVVVATAAAAAVRGGKEDD